MDNFWIYLIIGGIMLLAPKGIDKSNKKGTTEPSNNDSQEVPKDLEKQLRELLSEQSSEPQLPGNSTITRPVKTNVTTSVTHPIAPKKSPQVATKRKNNTNTPNAQNTPKASNSTPNTTSGQIEEILEDFTMEKAVIYSEILRPKYEEY